METIWDTGEAMVSRMRNFFETGYIVEYPEGRNDHSIDGHARSHSGH
jgi:hypothetical protein